MRLAYVAESNLKEVGDDTKTGEALSPPRTFSQKPAAEARLDRPLSSRLEDDLAEMITSDHGGEP
jgi:hypothetical protein